MDDNALGVKLVGEVEMNGVSGLGTYSGAGELAVDGDDHTFLAIWRPVHVFHLPFQMPDFSSRCRVYYQQNENQQWSNKHTHLL